MSKIFTPLGASNHSKEERQIHDYYATDPSAIDHLFNFESFNNVLECAAGEGHLAERIKRYTNCTAIDKYDRGYCEIKDFFDVIEWNGDIITNPPYKYALEFCQHALSIIPEGRKVAMFLKLTFLEGKKRYTFFKQYPPKTVYVFSKRIPCAKNGNFSEVNSAIAYAWFVWIKGLKSKTVIEWIPPYEATFIEPVHPGRTLQEIMYERNISDVELATLLDIDTAYIRLILNEQRSIGDYLASKLEQVLDIPKSFWLEKQKRYDEHINQ